MSVVERCAHRMRSWRAMAARARLNRPWLYISSGEYRRQRSTAKAVIAGAPPERLQELRQKYGRRLPGEGPEKYLWMQNYMEVAVGRVERLGLHTCSPGRVLDIGCGNGYFLAATRHFGHEILGIDIPGEPIYNDLIALFKIPREFHRIEAFQPLPDWGRFDLITGFMVCFNNLGAPEPWGAEEWRFFLDDCRSRLRPGGRIVLELNPGKRADYRYLSDQLAEQLRSYPGGSVSTDKSTITIETTVEAGARPCSSSVMPGSRK